MATKIDIVVEAVDNLSATVKKIENNVNRMTRSIQTDSAKVAKSTKQMSEQSVASMTTMTNAFSSFTVTARRFGALVGSFYAVRSAITAFASVADDFKDFNEAMAYVNTIAQMTDASLADLTIQVENLSVALGKSAPELARGLYDIYSSGFEGAEAMQILEVATRGAIAGLTTTEVAAKGLMAVMNAYNRKTGADAVDIMDSMFKTVDKGVITFEQLASEIGSVVTQSSQLGIPFTQVSAAMSEMTLRGISAAESATALESLMRSLMNPSDQAKKAIAGLNKQTKGLNFQWDIATLRAKGLNGMMKDLAKASQGNFEIVGELIPNIRGMRAAMVLATDDGKGFNKMLEEQANRAGATQRALEEANKSINRQLEEAKSEWQRYERQIGEVLANIQLKLMNSLVAFAKWANDNKNTIIALAKTIEQLTIAFIAYKAVVLAISGLKALSTWFYSLQAAIVFANQAMAVGVTQAVALRVALSALMTPIIIAIAVAGFAYVMYQLNQIKSLKQDILNQEKDTRTKIATLDADFAVKSINDQKALALVMSQAQKDNDTQTYNRAKKLNDNIVKLQKARETKADMLSAGITTGDRLARINNQIIMYGKAIDDYENLLTNSGKFTGGLQVNPQEGPIGLTTPEYGDFPSLDELLGSGGLDVAGKKIADTIDKVEKNISDYYIELGDLSNEHAKAIEDEGDAFEESALKWSRYLEDIEVNLTRMSDAHKKTISGIQDDIADENRDFAESMDDRLRKFNDTMSSMKTSHTDKTDDIQHQIDLETGLGIRADKEKLAGLYLRLERENRDYANKIAKDKEEKERADAEDVVNNAEAVTDFETRMTDETTAFEQKTSDIKTKLDREKADYFTQQDDIREKTQDTLVGIVGDYQKAFKDIFDAITDSGVPSLLAQLPGLTQTAIDSSIQGVDIPRNWNAENEFVKNWGGMYGRQPTKEEISTGVYGTANGPNNPVTVNIINPVVLDDSYTDTLIEKVETAMGNNNRLANSGAY